MSHYRTGRDDCTRANSHTFHDHGAVANPDIMANRGELCGSDIFQARIGVLEGMGTQPVRRMSVLFLPEHNVGANRTEAPHRTDLLQVATAADIGTGTDRERLGI